MVKRSGSINKENSLFRSRLDKAISTVISKNLAVKKNEKVLIVYDSKKEKLAKRFFRVATEISKNIDIIKIPLAQISGQEPPQKAAEKIKKSDVSIFITTKSLSHTKARRVATERGARIASMPGIKESILKRSIDIDYLRLKKEVNKVANLLDKAKKARIKTELGTDITFSLEKRKAHGRSAGIFNKKGKWGNLPEGEVFIAPLEKTANGHFVVDGSIAGFGRARHPLIFIVENGYVIDICDGKRPPKVKEVLDSVGKEGRNIAELGIGLNRKAKVTGVVLEDEKVYGTCHIALGNNKGFGGEIDVPLHIDCVMTKPTIYIDNKLIMKKGKLILKI